MGVKSLWSLLDLLETMEGKAMAIDSSIWIYQFQATMRDKEGRGWRICKLLFYGIKPVFVFDGGAPALKRSTISDRKRKKSGAAASHAKVAEKLLAAHMRRAALDHAQGNQSTTRRTKPGNTVYLEDLEGPGPVTPAKAPLPDVNMDAMVANATRTAAPDPRLATEEELRDFIEDMKPEDFDVTSPAFRELPTEVQYEIIGDLRLKSRQTSYKRLQNMLKKAHTPLDFSKEQIKNLKQRNSLTQQLLTTTDSIGKAHVEIPVRIASERNKQYVLIKNEGDEGGWILGIRDEGTRAKPIEIDQEDNKPVNVSDDSDEDMEEVPIAAPAPVDPDLRKHQRSEALSAIARRYKPKGLAPLTTKQVSAKSTIPLFVAEESDEDPVETLDPQEADEVQLAIAIQQSLEDQETDDLRAAVEASKVDARRRPVYSGASGSNTGASTSRVTLDRVDLPQTPRVQRSETNHSETTREDPYAVDSDDDLYASPSRLETALSIGNAVPRKPSTTVPNSRPEEPQSDFGVPVLLLPSDDEGPSEIAEAKSDSDEDMEEVAVVQANTSHAVSTPEVVATQDEPAPSPRIEPQSIEVSDSEEDLEEVVPPVTTIKTPLPLPASVQQDPVADQVEVLSDTPSKSPRAAEQKPVEQHEDWDAAQEMDPHAEEGEYVQFMSQVRGKNLEEVRREIDEEIKALNQQKKIAMRDSEDITQQMISQIMMMLRLFGIPMVDGIITDDSDVFLFGGLRVLRNMFNQSKTVECFLLSDLERDLDLTGKSLFVWRIFSVAIYGRLPGVGPVVAMELLTEFSGPGGLHEFREWWRKSKFRKRFKKRFKDLYLPEDWPNPACRQLEEPFKWGLPDLDALRGMRFPASPNPLSESLRHFSFFDNELGWSQEKVDDLLLPIIRKMGKRTQTGTTNQQGSLTSFFDVPAGGAAPRKRQAYASKRLQQVVSDFRKRQAADRKSGSRSQSAGSNDQEESDSETMPASRPQKKRKTGGEPGTREPGDVGEEGEARGRGRGGAAARRKKNDDVETTEQSSISEGELPSIAETPSVPDKPRPRPRPAYKQPTEEIASEAS
ncbi:hypothetical protein BC629DRAFT_1583625 [Irpex lacteus]|nr:hypothetical protein BC629DRAFT_1583625 [Irpex lacteus]